MTAIWALADLHLPFGNPEKSMEIFGPAWENYTEKIHAHWLACIKPEDLVLLPGDLSWAHDLETAHKDLDWIDRLPGTKLLIRGNHDYWWPTPTKLKNALPQSMHFIQNSAFQWMDVSIGGTRLWDCEHFSCSDFIDFKVNPATGAISPPETDIHAMRKIYERELHRLRLSLDQLHKDAHLKIVMTHYPPVSPTLEPSPVSAILEEYGVDVCVFGHLHNLKKNIPVFGNLNGVEYICVAGDYIDFQPIKIAPR
ncbi:MAG: metallophosphoesterase [Chlamydiia bacterium]|nr:metallophosphoesterase [Chlamydiia bacterium]MCP5509530.1 metallophosphoesterase [Chlamydiales bacterium]HPE84604.1 metallophosphoesterase [Chlamydiales bacterium]